MCCASLPKTVSQRDSLDTEEYIPCAVLVVCSGGLWLRTGRREIAGVGIDPSRSTFWPKVGKRHPYSKYLNYWWDYLYAYMTHYQLSQVDTNRIKW